MKQLKRNYTPKRRAEETKARLQPYVLEQAADEGQQQQAGDYLVGYVA